ncbi:MAG TPA: response regulator [Acidimicrobiales bacterium]|nr:response regulator [Acidimicrobiales bacterium]
MSLATRVVIAEDEAIIRLDLKETLEEEGYEVVGETGRGDEAVRLVREHEPELAILDIMMPGMDGLQAAREIAGDRRAAVLILTAFSQRDLIEQARDAGALAYLVKPFERNELIPAVEVALGRFNEMRALADQTVNLEEQLETRKIVDRAKGRLMDEHRLGESDAFSFIQKRAMSDRVTMRVIAEKVIAGDLHMDDALRAVDIQIGIYVQSDDEDILGDVTRHVVELVEHLGYGQAVEVR